MRAIVCLLAALFLLSSLGVAAERDPRKVDNASPVLTASRVDCDESGYTCYGDIPDVAIPDNDPDGIWIGPMYTGPGYTIQDVILDLEMHHTWVGDLIIEVWYDVDCDDIPDIEGGVLCRPGLEGCPTDGCCGCSGDFDDVYSFDDTAASIEDICPALFEGGCYGPDYDSIGLDVFDGLETGGCFSLHVIDGAAGDEGLIYSYEICILREPIATGPALDIKPTSCPNPFNLKAQGQLPVAVLSTETFDATMIDAATLELSGPDGSVEPIWHRYGDVATPILPDGIPCECTEEGPDGLTDLKLKFWRQDVVDILGYVDDGDMVPLTVAGYMLDGTPFEASDCVWILKKGKLQEESAPDQLLTNPNARESAESSSWGTIKALYR
jgi:hypothetical protein